MCRPSCRWARAVAAGSVPTELCFCCHWACTGRGMVVNLHPQIALPMFRGPRFAVCAAPTIHHHRHRHTRTLPSFCTFVAVSSLCLSSWAALPIHLACFVIPLWPLSRVWGLAQAMRTVSKVAVTMTGGATVCSGGPTLTRITFSGNNGNVPLLRPAFTVVGGTTATVSVSTPVQGTTEDVPCSNRGICSLGHGTCTCLPGFSPSDGNGLPGNVDDCGYDDGSVTSYCPGSAWGKVVVVAVVVAVLGKGGGSCCCVVYWASVPVVSQPQPWHPSLHFALTRMPPSVGRPYVPVMSCAPPQMGALVTGSALELVAAPAHATLATVDLTAPSVRSWCQPVFHSWQLHVPCVWSRPPPLRHCLPSWLTPSPPPPPLAALCPEGVAWWDEPYADNSAHRFAECSNMVRVDNGMWMRPSVGAAP